MANHGSGNGDLAERVAALEMQQARTDMQIGRLISDAESEKGTRSRVNHDIGQKIEKLDDRIRGNEKYIWMGLGALAVLQFALKFIGK